MIEIVNKFEKVIYASLMIMLMAVLLAAVIDLAWVLITTISTLTPSLLVAHEMITVLGAFLLVLIGVELLDTIKAYFHENTIHVEIVVLLAIIAISRKVILLDPSGMSGFDFGVQMIGIGVIVVGLAAAYYLLKKAGITIGPGMQKQEKKE
jgi:uncharacterized membrane protein (DUF373 family)